MKLLSPNHYRILAANDNTRFPANVSILEISAQETNNFLANVEDPSNRLLQALLQLLFISVKWILTMK